MSTARVIDNSEVGRQMASDAAKDEEKRQRKTAKTITREGEGRGEGKALVVEWAGVVVQQFGPLRRYVQNAGASWNVTRLLHCFSLFTAVSVEVQAGEGARG